MTETKPKWLQRLEKESWQAELIISGVAIYGTLQLPGYLTWLTDYFIDILPFSQYLAGYVIVYFSLIGVCVLTAFFLSHFILRAYWIGLIGLNSVYPEGIKEDGFYSPLYVRRMKKDIPPLPQSIRSIDNLCSSLFSAAFVFLMLYMMLSVMMLVGLFIFRLMSQFLPLIVFWILGGILGALMLFSVVLGIIANHKKNRNKAGLQYRYYWISKILGYILASFLYKPIYQILNTFTTNYDRRKSNPLLIIYFFVVIVALSTMYAAKTNIFVLIRAGLDKDIYREMRIYPEFYEDQYPAYKAIVTPILSTQHVDDGLLKLFIPVMDHEKALRKKICNLPAEGDISASELASCYTKYHKITVDDILMQVQFDRGTHYHRGEYGLFAFLPLDDISEGRHVVTITKHKDLTGEDLFSFSIPFWVTK